MNPDNYLITLHANQVMTRRGISMDAVMDVVENYDICYDSPVHNGRRSDGTQVFQKGTLAVVAKVESDVRYKHYIVKTVLLKSSKDWTDEDALNRERR